MARVFISHSSRDNESAARIKTWLAEQGFETPFLDYDKHAGIPPGADWEKTLYIEIELSEAVVIIQTPNWLDSKWCFAEFTQARALGKSIFPIIETPTGDTLISSDIQALDLSKDREGGLEQLSNQLTQIALDAQGGFGWDASRPPYPGLLAFQEEDAALYFGRDDDIRRLIERLDARRAQGGSKLIALLGSSGSGKSSLLRAGVIPRLKRAGRNWVVLPAMRPQVHPVDELARCLAVACGADADWRKLREALYADNLTQSLSDIANDLRMRASANEAEILLPIDQGEELFGAADPDQARRFCEIINIALSSDLPFIAVIAMRSDYLGLLQSAEHLNARFEEFSLGPLPLARIAQIIEGPARVAGLGIDEAFVHQAVKDAKTEDALPLLAFALRELYDSAADNNYLSLAEYNALGDTKEGLTPLENAVRKAADNVLAEARPSDEELTALREAFVPAMVRVNDQGEYVRQPARWDDLPSKAHALLERLAKARLLIVSQDGDERMVEVAHEALLRKWPRLRTWLDDAREFLTGKQQLQQDLHDWEKATDEDKADALLSGLKLNRAHGWFMERPHQLSTQERALIKASIDHAEAEEVRRQADQTRKLLDAEALAEANRKTAKRTKIGLTISIIFLVLAGGSAFSAWKRADEARKSEHVARQSEKEANVARESANMARDKAKRNLLLSANSALAFSTQGENSQLVKRLALDYYEELVQLWRIYNAASVNDSKRESALRLIGARSPSLRATFRYNKPIKKASFSLDGAHVMAIDNKDTLYITDVNSGMNITDVPLDKIMRNSAHLSSDVNRIFVNKVLFPDAGHHLYAREVPKVFASFKSPVLGQHGMRVLTLSQVTVDQTAGMWTLEGDGTKMKGAKFKMPGQLKSITFTTDQVLALVVVADEGASIWDLKNEKKISDLDNSVVLKDCTDYFSCPFSQDGTRVLVNKGTTAEILEVKSGKTIAVLELIGEQTSPPRLNINGTRVLTVSGSNVVSVWDVNSEARIAKVILPVEKIYATNFGPKGPHVLSIDYTSVRLWDLGGQVHALFNNTEQWLSESSSFDSRKENKANGYRYVFINTVNGSLIDTESWNWTNKVTGLQHDSFWQPPINQRGPYIFAYSPNRTRLLTWNIGSIYPPQLWDVNKEKLIADLKQPKLSLTQDQVELVAFSPDGTSLVTTRSSSDSLHYPGQDDGDRVVGHRLWDAITGKPLPAKSLLLLAASPDGNRIITTSEPHTETLTPLLWDTKTKKQLNQLEGHTKKILATKFSSDSKRILTRSKDRTTSLWEAETGKLTAILDIPGAQFEMPNAVFSPDGNLVVTTTRVGTNIETPRGLAVLWDVKSGMMVQTFESDSPLMIAKFSPDSMNVTFLTIKVGTMERGMEVWNLHQSADDVPECLRLSIEIRTGLAWNDNTNRTYRLSYNDMSERREQLREKYDGQPCDIPAT